MNQPLIQFKNISKSFGSLQVLQEANLSIYQGEVITIIGKSGGGKSVLLKLIIGLLEPDSGEILFQGRSFWELKKTERRALKKKFSYMFQGTALFDSMTVFENIALPLKEKTSLNNSEIKLRVEEKIKQLDMHEINNKYPSQLSGGMKKRVALARALVTDPEIVLFDEPTTGLDPIRKNAVHNMISEYQKKFGFTGIVVSHEIPDVFYISQRILMLDGGSIIFEGTPREIQRTENIEVQQFIHGIENDRSILTGIAPPTRGEMRFREEMARLQRHQISFSIILFTVQNLDEIKDTLGPMAIQTVLNNFARRIQKRLRVTDTCSRHGLSRIMVLLSNTDSEQAKIFCTSLGDQIKGSEIFEIQPRPGFCLSISAGFVEAQQDSPLEKLLESAVARQQKFYDFQVC
ncbi:MAG: ATP-binding cassette domain-containing protein [Desulfobacterales bacterium]|nr:ATP-binding cassette domain-containing protein [Desulfobacterales bacterium]